MLQFRRSSTALLIAGVLLTAAGCANNQSTTTPTQSGSPTTVASDKALHDSLPAKIKDSGKLEIGINLTYPPDEFKDPQGNATGWGVDLIQAVSHRLGVEPVLHESQFDNIFPGVKGAKYDIGVGSFTDTKERQQSVDFVDYYTAGTQWASTAGKKVDPTNACGLTLAVGAGTYQETDELPAISKKCEADGKAPLTILKLDTQGDITNAVALGRANAFSADSPVTQYAVQQSGGKVELSSEIMEAAPFGWALAKDNTQLRDAVAKALQSLMDDGTYDKILAKWGVQAGAVKTAGLNLGSS